MGLISRVSSRTYRKSLTARLMAAMQNLRPNQAQLDKFQLAYKQIGKIQQDIRKHTAARQTLDAQLHEHSQVLAEVNLCDKSALLFKQVGPILCKQDYDEVKMNVKKRIDYIKAEMTRHDKGIEDGEKKTASIQVELKQIEQQLAQQMQAAGMSMQPPKK